MAKNTKQYVLVDITEMSSKLNGGVFYRLTWVCIDDLTRWEMDVQDNYNNYLKNGWRSIVENNRWGVYQGMRETNKRTKAGVPILHADSKPECVIEIESQDLAVEVVMKELERVNQQRANSTFDQIFALN